jgi:hypothetical protein
MNLRPTRFRKMLSIGLMVAVGGFYTTVTSSALAQSQGGKRSAGELSVTGSVTINGTSAISGATVFSESRIRTASNSSAIINLGRLGRLQLGPESEMTVRFADGALGGNLTAGRAVANAPVGVAVSIVTSEGVAASNGSKSAALAVDVTCGNTRVLTARSEATLTSGTKVETIVPGKEVAVGQAKGTCSRIATSSLGTGLSTGALAALIIAGIGGGVGGAIAVSQSDNVAPSSIVVSGFRP